MNPRSPFVFFNFNTVFTLHVLVALTFAQSSYAQNSNTVLVPPPVIPDARKPSRGLQPTLETNDPSKAPPTSVDPGTEEIFAPSTHFKFELQPANHEDLPTDSTLMQTSVKLYQKDNVYSGSADSKGAEITLTLEELSTRTGSLTDSARVSIQNAVVANMNTKGIGGVACLIEPAANAQGTNTMKVVAAQFGGVRTIASGVRAGETGQSINDANQQRIKDESPLKEGDVMKKEVLEDYLYSLSRFPGRTVSAAVSNEPSSAQVVLDYYVQEKKVFDVYAGVSNTGTTETSKFQYRVGLLATQLTNNDDILSIDYQNSNFQDTQSVNSYYDARVGTMQDLRWRLTGQWGQYYSSDLGLAEQDFSGNNWGVQGELIWTFLQKGNSFLDVDAGVKTWGATTENTLLQTNGSATFVTLSAMFNVLSTGDTWAFQGSFGGMYTTTDASQQSLDELGRTDTSKAFSTINGSVYGSFYLDPFLDSSWSNSQSLYKPLIHEIFGSVRGQYAFDYRLTPLSQYTMGGLYTVRGFAQSLTAGDNALVGTIEYRMHLPRMFTPTVPTGSFPSASKPFKWAPDSSTGAAPDWDLVFSTFFDAGTVSSNQAYEFEVNTPMYSAGVGLDLNVLTNISVGLDWAWALNSIESTTANINVESGSSQFWFTATLVY